MKKFTIFSAAIIAASMSNSAWAQHDHSDLEFGYDDTANPTSIVIENDNESSDGIQFYEAEFEALDPFNSSDLSADEPGFTTEAAEGLLFNTGDQISICPVNASGHSGFGVGFVNYYNPSTGMLEASNRLSVVDNSAGTTDLVLDGAASSGDALQFLGTVDADGDLHDHLLIDLLDDGTAPAGAYGVLFQIHAVQAGGAPDIVSDPVWFIFNHELSEEQFEGAALASFGIVEAVPEPSSLALLLTGATCLVLRRRR